MANYYKSFFRVRDLGVGLECVAFSVTVKPIGFTIGGVDTLATKLIRCWLYGEINGVGDSVLAPTIEPRLGRRHHVTLLLVRRREHHAIARRHDRREQIKGHKLFKSRKIHFNDSYTRKSDRVI